MICPHRIAALLVALVALWPAAAAARARVVVWCAYTGQEERGLRAALEAFEREHGVAVDLLGIPFGAYLAKLEAAIPTGNGPDLFIDAHERLPLFVRRELAEPWPGGDAQPSRAAELESALTLNGRRYGVPLAVKSLALYVNEELVRGARLDTTADLLALRSRLPPGVVPLAFESENPYYVAPFLHAFGGALLSASGGYGLVGAPAERTLELLRDYTRSGVVPAAPSGDLVKRLFASGQAATAISGPWLAGDLPASLRFRIQPLPRVSEASGAALEPYVTVEAAFVARTARQRELARKLALYLASGEGARLRAELGGQVVSDPEVTRRHGSSRTRALARAAEHGRPMPVHPNMRAVWEPAGRAIRSVMRGGSPVRAALQAAEQQFARSTRPPQQAARPLWGLLFMGMLALAGAFRVRSTFEQADLRRRLRGSLPAYAYLAQTALAVLALVVLPLAVGFAASFFTGQGRDWVYVGLGNYVDILSGSGGELLSPGSFWFVLCVTLLWTASNVVLHLVLGGTLALLLQRTSLGVSRLYRVALILPWAVPSYVTALTWKGMFHRQFGAINALLEAFGVPALDWFSRWITAFSANLLTNLWLGFPFMMVVTLGGLTSIPKEVYEAAEVDGAAPAQRFRAITLPMLWPVLAPAVLLGTAWTFNMFNVVFLVSGGEPAGTTEILVSEAYRWAFTRSAQYGYAAAYAVLIFVILLLGTRLGRRPARVVGAT